jgi:hypothetical protein
VNCDGLWQRHLKKHDRSILAILAALHHRGAAFLHQGTPEGR